MESWKEIIQTPREKELPKFNPGDNVDVLYRVIEGEKERIQVFSGVVIARHHDKSNSTFTVRKIGSGGIGVERIFPVNSPFISEIKVKRLGSVRRSKLYYLRGKKGKAARVKEKATFHRKKA